MKKFIPILLVAAAGFAFVAWWKLKALPVEVTSLQRGPIAEVVSQEGAVKAKDEVEVAFEINGRIASLNVGEGQKVASQQLLAALDDASLRLDLEQAGTQVEVEKRTIAELEVALEEAERDYERCVKLLRDGVISSDECDRAGTKRDAAQKKLETSKARLNLSESSTQQAQVRLDKARIYSPVEGVVIDVYSKVGEVSSPGKPIVRIITSHDSYIEVEIAEADFGKVYPGQDAIITSDAYAGATIKGKLERIDPFAMRKGSIIEVTRAAEEKIFRGVVTPDLPDARLVPGLSVYVDFVVKRKEEALLVPREAVRETASAYTVYVVRKGRAYVQDVEIGLKDSLSVEILKGLEERDVVITSPPESLRDRARVRIGKRFPGR